MRSLGIAILTPPNLPDPAVAIAASRAGATGVLNLEFTADVGEATHALRKMARLARGQTGIRISSASPRLIDAVVRELPDSVGLAIVTAEDPDYLAALIKLLKLRGRDVWLEATSEEQARLGAANSVDGIVAKGNEAGGWVGEETTLVLLQRLLRAIPAPIWAYGGIGLHTAAAVAAAGAAGIVLDSQLFLTRESALPAGVKDAVAAMDGSETICLGLEAGAQLRLYSRPRFAPASRLAEAAAALAADPADAERTRRWREVAASRVGWDRPEEQVWPLGQDAAFAAGLADRYRTVGGVVQAFQEAVDEHLTSARRLRPLDAGGPLAASHGTRYPIVQGPMTRVSDTAEFALRVAEGGGLPFLASALMRGPELEELLRDTQAKLGALPWGVGILGFVPVDLRQEQLEVIRRYKPPFALIAGGRPDQAKALESEGIATYLHVPSPGLLRMFLQDGARRFVFEGRECGGHVGPRSSFVLWNTMIDVLLAELPASEFGKCHVLFAGGVCDRVSGAMVSAMAAPLAQRGCRVGVLVGTAYLFTEEAVSSGAILPGFQRKALECHGTILVESGPGYAIRCVPNAFTNDVSEIKRQLTAEGKPSEEIRQALEEINVGRLRIASKGLTRNPRYQSGKDEPKLVPVAEQEQERSGMYMIGQVAALRNSSLTISELHRDICQGGSGVLENTANSSRAQASPVEPRPLRIAIVGMSCILPKAPDLAAYWHNILNKVYAVTEVPKHRWDWEMFFDSDRNAKDKSYSKWGGFIDEVAIDPVEFGMPPNALPSIDPMQLLALQAASAAIKDAGYATRPFDRRRASVILGVGGGMGALGEAYITRSAMPVVFGEAAPEIVAQTQGILPQWTEDSFPGFLLNVTAGRIANRLDFGGFNYIVDAACASSLAAVHLAARELESGNTDLVIAGGVDTMQSPFYYLCFSKTHALSPTGQPRTFDAAADGITISEGVCMIVLKRLEDAERGGDRIYAVIQGTGASSDGKALGLTAPRREGQVLALERAYENAGVSPTTVSLFEAHGTGTVVGDRTEALSLAGFLQAHGAAPAAHAVGSVKSMIGHTKAAAGITGLAKVALALHHKILPPTMGVTTPNPKAGFGDGPLYVNSETRPWIHAKDYPRRAGVSAFGFGGTNFHAVVEEYAGDYLQREAVSAQWPSELFLWSAADREQLIADLAALEKSLQDATPSLHDLAYTLAHEYEARWSGSGTHLAVVAAGLDDLRQKLAGARTTLAGGGSPHDGRRGAFFTESPLMRAGEIALLFPGQGSQYPNMLRDLAVHFEVVREVFERADRTLADRYPRPLSETIFPPPAFGSEQEKAQQQALMQTHVAQPGLGAAGVAVLRLLESLGIRGSIFAGHSYGEFVALHAAGVFDESTLAVLSEARGRSIRECGPDDDLGTMAAVSAGLQEIVAVIGERDDVWPANMNAPRQTVLSGTKAGIQAAAQQLEAKGMQVRMLPVACAFHSPLVAPAQRRLAKILTQSQFSAPQATVFSNTTAGVYPTESGAIVQLLSQHLVQPVRFAEEVEAMYAAGARIFIEAGPRSVLTSLVGSILGERPHLAAGVDQPGQPGLTQLQTTLAQLAAHGVRISPAALFQGRKVRLLDLQRLAEDTRQKPLSPTAWLVDGQRARPCNQPPATIRRAVWAPAAGNSGTRLLPPGGSAVDQVMLQFQTLMGKFLDTQREVMSAYLDGTPAPAVPVRAPTVLEAGPAILRNGADVPHAATTNRNKQALTKRLVQIVSERTGYPAEMLSLTADVEAELGIDSIKRVEIIGALQKDFLASGDALGPEAMDQLTAVKTLSGIVEWMDAAFQAVPHGPTPQADGGGRLSLPGREEIQNHLVKIVAERTGYPAEMLNLDADVEAELGIDSIKRVEIIGALQQTILRDERHFGPEAMDQLTAIKTLRGITDWVAANLQERPQVLRSALPRMIFAAVEAPAKKNGSLRADTPATLLVTRDERGIADLLAKELGNRGWEVVLVRPGAGLHCSAPGMYEADISDPEVVRQLLEELRKHHSRVSGIVHLAALAEAVPGEPDFATFRQRLGRGVKSLFHLLHAAAGDLKGSGATPVVLAAAGMGGTWGSALMVDTSRDREGAPDAPESSVDTSRDRKGAPRVSPDAPESSTLTAAYGPLAAMIKCAAVEWPSVRCKVVDVDLRESAAQISSHLIGELESGDSLVQTGYAGGKRFVLDARPAALVESEEQIPIDSDSVILVTGGARGVTAEVAAHLAALYRPKLILAGLSPRPDPDESRETATARSPQELKKVLIKLRQSSGQDVVISEIEARCSRILKEREIRRNLGRMRRSGAAVQYEQVDVCDEAAMTGLLQKIQTQFGRLDGVIHGAGVIDDKKIEDKLPAAFDRVFDTKANSAFILSRVLPAQRLKFFVLFSSVAGAWGNRGQIDYAAANEFVNKLAIGLDARWPGRVVSIVWGPWAGSGMLAAELQRQLAGRGIALIDAAEGCAAFDRELRFGRKGTPVVVLGSWPTEQTRSDAWSASIAASSSAS